jgi:hypothetical protein
MKEKMDGFETARPEKEAKNAENMDSDCSSLRLEQPGWNRAKHVCWATG